MGWSSGSVVFEKIIRATKTHIPDFETRKALYKDFIKTFEDADWDNIDECMGDDPAYDAAAKELHPDWFDEAGDLK